MHNIFRGLIGGLCLLWVVPAMAQITITKAGYPFKAGPDSASFDYRSASISVPEHGANKTWDYSGLKEERASVGMYYDANNSELPGATHMYKSAYDVSIFKHRAEDYYRLDETGFYDVGRKQFDTTFSLTAVTGGPNDVMHFPTATVKFKERTIVKFPLNYEDEWSNVEEETTKFNLTIQGYGLNNTPGEIVKYRYYKRKVVGWGKLIIPDGNGKASGGIDVLLLHVADSAIDSVFLGGAPAPDALLSAFGFVQGRTISSEGYAFETKDFGYQPLGIFLKEDVGGVDYAFFRTRASRLAVSAEVPTLVEADVWPTYLKGGSLINVSSQNSTIAGLSLVGVDGKTYPLTVVGDGRFQIPAVSSGIYMYEVRMQNEPTVVRGKLWVSE